MTKTRQYAHTSGKLKDIAPDDSTDWVGYRLRDGSVWWANYPSAAYNGTLVVAGTRLACEAADRLFAQKVV